MFHRRAAFALAAILAWTSSPVARAAGSAGLAAHRAAYRLGLATARNNDVVDATGTMTFKVMNACDGWAVQQRLTLAVVNRQGPDTRTISNDVTWEAKNGLSFQFRLTEATNGGTPDRLAGTAMLTRPGGPGMAIYTAPRSYSVALPAGTLFPMAQTAALIAAAHAGHHFLAVPLFDGTSAHGAQDSFTVITKRRPPGPAPYPALASLASQRVHIGFFRPGPATMLPDFQTAMRYWDNGVADGLKLDFGDVVVGGKLTSFHLLPSHC